MAWMILTIAVLGVVAVATRPRPAEKRDAIPVRVDDRRRPRR